MFLEIKFFQDDTVLFLSTELSKELYYMEKIKLILKNIGLTSTETEIYLAGLSYVSIGVSELEKQTRIKRTTIYHAIETLQAKGLCGKKGTGSRLVFTMTKPENIERLIGNEISRLENQRTELQEIVPLLNQRLKQDESKIQVTHYEGIEGIKLVVEEALYARVRHWDILAPAKNFFSEFDKSYARYFMETRTVRKISARSLWEQEAGRRVLTAEEIRLRNPRYLPDVMKGKFRTVIIIFDDKVAYISSLKELSAVLIQSEEMTATVKAMFDGLWEVSLEYGEIKNS